MKINYNLTGTNRKSLVNAISKKLNTTSKYLGVPTFAYEVGDYLIDKNGVLTGPDNYELVESLKRLHNIESITEEYDLSLETEKPITNSFQGNDEVGELYKLIIRLPRAGFTEQALENLKGLIKNKEKLIKKALGVDSLQITIDDEAVAFPWFRTECSSDEVKAYTDFVTALCNMAKKQQRVNVTEKPVENEKYAFRCFLLRLGFIGPEYKMQRKILLSKLEGNSAFKFGTNSEVVENE